jgi:hypothetical protein
MFPFATNDLELLCQIVKPEVDILIMVDFTKILDSRPIKSIVIFYYSSKKISGQLLTETPAVNKNPESLKKVG